MNTPKEHQNANSKPGEEQKDTDFVRNSEEISSPNTKVTEQLLRGIFTKHRESSEHTSESLTQELSEAFRLFRSGFSADLPERGKRFRKDDEMRERILNLQKRTSDTLRAVAKCKDDVSSIAFLETKLNQSSEVDELSIPDTRSLDELTTEIKKIQNRHPSFSAEPTIERPDIEDMKNATHKLLDELGLISNNYNNKGKNNSFGLSSTPRK